MAWLSDDRDTVALVLCPSPDFSAQSFRHPGKSPRAKKLPSSDMYASRYRLTVENLTGPESCPEHLFVTP